MALINETKINATGSKCMVCSKPLSPQRHCIVILDGMSYFFCHNVCLTVYCVVNLQTQSIPLARLTWELGNVMIAKIKEAEEFLEVEAKLSEI